MTNEVTKREAGHFGSANIPMNLDQLDAGLTKMQSFVPASMTVPILKLGKGDGIWIYGADDVEVQEGSQWAVNPYSFQRGWACWNSGELLDENMVPMTSQPVEFAELPDHGLDEKGMNPWKRQTSVNMVCLNGEDEGVEAVYKGTAVGMLNAINGLLSAIMAQRSTAQADFYFPVLLLESTSYKHKQWGKTYTPELRIVDWMNDRKERLSQIGQIAAAPAEAPPAAAAPVEAPPAAAAPVEAPPAAAAPAEAPPAAAAPVEAPPATTRRRRAPIGDDTPGLPFGEDSGSGLPPKQQGEAVARRRRQAV